MNKILFFNRYAPHYRRGIYELLDKELDVDFYFGNKKPGKIEKMDYTFLNNFKYELKNVDVGPFYYQSGAIKLLFKPYTNYITSGDYNSISTWLFFFLSKFFRNKKVFIWTHGWYGNESFFKKILKKFFYSFPDGILLYGNHSKNLMIEQGFHKSKMEVVYNSLNYKEQIQIRKLLKLTNVYTNNFKNDYLNIIFIGRLTKIKQLNLLVESIHELSLEKMKLNLTVIGVGDEELELKNLVNKLELNENVWFYGACYEEKLISELIYNADLCVSPGNVGLTAMHSMVYGTPVITHNNFELQMPEFEAIVSKYTGDYFEYNNQQSLSLTIKEWFKVFASKREEIRDNCFKVIDDKFNPHYQLEVIRKLIENINKK
jgi:glycosyltransferase involved in cell wall biosynthesis